MTPQEKQRIKRILENARKEKNKEKKCSTILTKQEMSQIIEGDRKLQQLGIKIGAIPENWRPINKRIKRIGE